jgi:DNA (cytosine-5)-methyltransferase 1
VKIIDLFCGAGGFSLGAHLAGFHTALAVDKDIVLTSSFSCNFPSSKLLIRDLSRVAGTELLTAAGVGANEDIGLIGGPPCQGFSLMGKRLKADPRNDLLRHYFRLVSEIRPKFFVMENVPGLLLGSSRQILDEAIACVRGYEIVGPMLLNANEFGAATNRHRVVLVGLRGRGVLTERMILDARSSTKATVIDAISDIPPPNELGVGRYRRNRGLSTYAADARTTRDLLGSMELKAYVREGFVRDIFPTRHTSDVVMRFASVSQGQSDPISRCPRLSWDRPAPTLRAGTGAERGSFQAIRPLHPNEDRVITVREAARLQGFPDWFTFHRTKWHSFRMIGNSVSPQMSKAIMGCVHKALTVGRDGNSGNICRVSRSSQSF